MHKKCLVHGEAVFYEELGQGSPVVLLHGSLCDYRYWRWQIKALSEHHRVIAPSLPGYWPALDLHHFSTPSQTELIEGLLSQLVPSEPYHLLGHSRGAQVALQLSMQSSASLASLTLADPGFRLPDDEAYSPVIHDTLALLEQGDTEAALALFIDTVNGPDTWRQMVGWFKTMVRENAPTLAKQAQEQHFMLDLEALKQKTFPALLLSGQHSPARYKRCIEAVKQQLPHAYTLTISQAAHGMNLANPKAFNQSVSRFFNAVDQRQTGR